MNNREKIRSACVIHPSGQKLCWPTHMNAMLTAIKHGVQLETHEILWNTLVKGFLTDTERFVSREEGWRIAFEAGQIPYPTKELFSDMINLK